MSEKTRKRKIHRYSKMLFHEFHVNLSESPTKVLAITNGGLVNGLSEQKILEEFSQYGKIDRILTPRWHSVSFVQFDSIEASSSAVLGKPLIWERGGPAFLVYVDEIPRIADDKTNSSPPPGLIILEDFISEKEEKNFFDYIQIDEKSSNLKHRAVKHFGHVFRYSDNRADDEPCESIPKEFEILWTRLKNQVSMDFQPNQCTINRYEPGQGIPPHVDTHSAFSETIACLSLQSSVLMDWRKGEEHRQVLVPQRSLMLFTGEARYSWTHGITPRKNDITPANTVLPRSLRTSITFRRTREGPCLNCPFPTLCDTETKINMQDQVAAKLEEDSVHRVYEEIAQHFSLTRHKPWPNVVKFIKTFKTGEIILDIGCGNGKYLGVREDIQVIGLDMSVSLLQLCGNKYQTRTLIQGDCLNLPFLDNSADGIISIAVLHHLSTEERRLRAIREIRRVLRGGGRALIYVWAKNQQADSNKSAYLKQRKQDAVATPGHHEIQGVRLPIHTNRTNFTSADMFVPWQEKTSGATFLRFYHVFEEDELEKLCSKVSQLTPKEYYYDQGNWCIVLEKVEQ